MTILPKKKVSGSSKGQDHHHRDSAGSQGSEFQLSHPTNPPVVPGSGGSNGWGPGVPSGSSSGWSPPPSSGWPSSSVSVNTGSNEFVVETGSKRSSSSSFVDEAGGPSASKRRHRERASSAVQAGSVGSSSSEVPVSVSARVGSSPVNPPGPVLPSTTRPSCSPTATQAGTSEEGAETGGYNSEDEYSHLGVSLTEEEWLEKDRKFEKMMKKKGFVIKKMTEDGSCLFRAVADQLYGDQEMHPCVRRDCMDYIAQNADYYSHYVTEAISDYIERKRYLGVHGNHLEIQALSEMYSRPIHIFCYSPDPINIFQCGYEHSNAPIRLSYHRGVHYNSLIDPYQATIGVGLGLPGFNPGAADRNLLSQAYRASEDSQVERAMLEDKIRATDWEATNEAIEEQVARESYLQWLRDNERRNKTGQERSSTVTSGALRAEALRPRSPKAHSPKPGCSHAQTSNASNSPKAGCSFYSDDRSGRVASNVMSKDFQLMETASFLNGLPPEMFGLEDWSETDVLTRVIAASQQEYLDSMKKKHTSAKAECAEESSSGMAAAPTDDTSSAAPAAVSNNNSSSSTCPVPLPVTTVATQTSTAAQNDQ